MPVGAVLLILVASVLSFAPVFSQAAGAVGSVSGDALGPRIAIGGSGGGTAVDAVPDVGAADNGQTPGSDVFLDDGTLLKPVAVDTSVEDGSDLLRHYTVRQGDTLTGIASRFGLSMKTLWWANHLTSKDALHIGQVLTIPPVNGVVITVTASDTIQSLGAKYGVDPSEIMAENGLTDPTLVIGQILILPGGHGPGIPATRTPSPTSSPTRRTTTTVRAPSYSGGRLAWPVVGGGNYISQYFWSGHPAIDIAATYGTTVVAAAGAKVIFAGWKNNCGGYQVWLSHGNNFYTGYYHLSSISVGSGQYVSRGQQIGRVGMSGCATGPHTHFETWIGPMWDGGYRVNPLRYY